MRRFHFQLEPLLRLTRQLLSQSESQLLQATNRLEASRHELERLQVRLDQAANDVNELASPNASAHRLNAHHLFVHRQWIEELRRSVAVAVRTVDQALQNQNTALETRRTIAVDLEALEELKSQRWLEHCDQVEESNQQQMDDFAMRGWQAEEPPAPSEDM